MDTAILSLKNLTFYRNEKPIFEPITFDVFQGDVVHVKGKNGSGKTTLLRMLIGALHPTEGNIEYNHIDINRTRFEYLSNLVYVGHKVALKSSLTALENLAWISGRDKKCESLIKALEDMGLSEKKNVLCSELSVGQQRKLTLARILVSDAKIWFLDEPFNTLDSDGFTLLKDLIEAHKNNQGIVVYASHQNVSISDVKTIQLEKAIP